LRKSISRINNGFSAVEALLVIVIVAAVVGTGLYINHRHKSKVTSSTSSVAKAPTPSAQPGTTASITQLTQQDATTEQAVDKNYDSQTQQTATSANPAAANVGGAYDASSL
jgi:uncharacterized protein (UPF0333 family)